MTLRDYLKVARRWALVVVLGCVLSRGSPATTRMDKVCRARRDPRISAKSQAASSSYGAASPSQDLAARDHSNNLGRAAQILGNTNIQALQKKVRGRRARTQLIEVLAEDRNADRAALIANTVVASSRGYVEEAQLAGSETRTRSTPSSSPRNARPEAQCGQTPRERILGLVLGLMVIVPPSASSSTSTMASRSART
jgi:hypothetical protein